MALAPATVQRMPARLSRAPDLLASGLDDGRGDAQSPGAELRIAHPVAVAEHIVDALSRLWLGLGMGAQRGDERTEPAGVQLGMPVLGPRVDQLGPGAVDGLDGLGHVAQILLGVVDIDDFDGAGKVLGRQMPDPGGAVAKDDTAGCGVEAAPLRLAIDALREGGWQRVGVAAGRALDRGVVAGRPVGFIPTHSCSGEPHFEPCNDFQVYVSDGGDTRIGTSTVTVILGHVAATETADGADAVAPTYRMTPEASMWIAVRAWGTPQRRPRDMTVPHSAPIHVVVNDEPTSKREAVAALVAHHRVQLRALPLRADRATAGPGDLGGHHDAG